MSSEQLTQRAAFTEVSFEPIVMTALEARVLADDIGAAVSFVGRVRNHDHGRAVVSLEYEAHPIAGDVLQRLVQQVCAQYAGVRIAAVHRVGRLEIGDTALGVVAAAAHRGEALAACESLVELIKSSVPIWKLQTFEDGSTEWVNCL